MQWLIDILEHITITDIVTLIGLCTFVTLKVAKNQNSQMQFEKGSIVCNACVSNLHMILIPAFMVFMF